MIYTITSLQDPVAKELLEEIDNEVQEDFSLVADIRSRNKWEPITEINDTIFKFPSSDRLINAMLKLGGSPIIVDTDSGDISTNTHKYRYRIMKS